MARIGYARVSTTDQDLDIQIGRLKNAGCEIIRSETGSGASRSGRTELETIMQFMHTGDELVVLRLDRLGRSTRDVLNLVHELDEKGASLRILEPEVTTAGDMGRMVITILGMVADMELKFIKDRQRAGIEAARAEAFTKAGRRTSMTMKSAVALPPSQQSPRCPRPEGLTNDRLSGARHYSVTDQTAGKAAHCQHRPASDYRELQQAWKR
ncbi:recombinase family protein [Rhizorhabdus histidinilytica]